MKKPGKFKAYFFKHSRSGVFLSWVKLGSITASAQILIQAIGFIAGILVIRLLSVEEYAYYTIANMMLGTMTILADGGIAQGVLTEGGKVWKDPDQLGSVVVTGLKLRRRFALGSLILTVPVLSYLLQTNGASWSLISLICLSVIPAFYAGLSDTIYQVVPKLHTDVGSLQKNQVGVALGRLFLMSCAVFVFPFTFVALLGTGIPRIFGNRGLLKINTKYANFHSVSSKVVEKRILKIVRRILPGSIYYCFYGQISIFLISFFGTTGNVAELGALSRFTASLSLIAVMGSVLIIPIFAKLKSKRQILLNNFSLSAGLLLLSLSCICGVFFLFSSLFLSILGNAYSGLDKELVLCMIGGSLSVLSGMIFSLNASRGWVLSPVISISSSLISIVLGALLFEVSELIGVLNYSIFLALTTVVMNTAYFAYNVFVLKEEVI